jgi:ABC-type xylose transport system permease subunit
MGGNREAAQRSGVDAKKLIYVVFGSMDVPVRVGRDIHF